MGSAARPEGTDGGNRTWPPSPVPHLHMQSSRARGRPDGGTGAGGRDGGGHGALGAERNGAAVGPDAGREWRGELGGVLLLLPPGSGCWRGADHHFRWVFLRGFTARTSLSPPRPAPMQGVLSDRSSMPQPDPSDAGKGAASLTAPLPSVGLGMAHVALPLPHPGYTCPQRGRDLIPLSASLGERSQRNPNCIITLASPICLNNPP